MPVDLQSDDWVREVQTFWFDEVGSDGWFKKSDVVDAQISAKFSRLHDALTGLDGPEPVLNDADTALAALIVLDQFSRNLFRDSPRAFAADPLALRIANAGIERGYDQAVAQDRRVFFYMPYEHSEDAADQVRSVELIGALELERFMSYVQVHKDIIDRFGRFPHRNAVLGRESTAEELAFLNEPRSSF